MQNAGMRCKDKVSASHVRLDLATQHHDPLFLLPVSSSTTPYVHTRFTSLWLSRFLFFNFILFNDASTSLLGLRVDTTNNSLSYVLQKFIIFIHSRRCQYYLFRYPWVPALQGVIAFFVLANFTLATFMDPGVIPKGKSTCAKLCLCF